MKLAALKDQCLREVAKLFYLRCAGRIRVFACSPPFCLGGGQCQWFWEASKESPRQVQRPNGS